MSSKTGAVAVGNALSHICRVVGSYGPKLIALVAAAEAASIISSGEAVTASAVITGANSLCDIWKRIVAYWGTL